MQRVTIPLKGERLSYVFIRFFAGLASFGILGGGKKAFLLAGCFVALSAVGRKGAMVGLWGWRCAAVCLFCPSPEDLIEEMTLRKGFRTASLQ